LFSVCARQIPGYLKAWEGNIRIMKKQKNSNVAENDTMIETLKKVLSDLQDMQIRSYGVESVFDYLQLPPEGQEALMYFVVNSKAYQISMLRENEQRVLSLLLNVNCKMPSLQQVLHEFRNNREAK
jgi:hypothetical protein